MNPIFILPPAIRCLAKAGWIAAFVFALQIGTASNVLASVSHTVKSTLYGAVLSSEHTQLTLTGWACIPGDNTPLTLEVYRNGLATYSEAVEIPGTFLANLPSDAKAKAVCNSKTGHQFSITIPTSLRTSYPGQQLVVYAVNPMEQNQLVQVPEVDAPGNILAKIYSPNVFFVPPPVQDPVQNMANIQKTLAQAYNCQAQPSTCANTGTSPPEVQVLLAGGAYDLCATPVPAPPNTVPGNYCLTFYYQQNVIFGGSQSNSEIVLQNPNSGYILSYVSNNLQIEDLSFDMATPPFSQGVIKRVNRASDGVTTTSIDVQVAQGFPTFADPLYQYAGGFLAIMDGSVPRIKRNVPNFMSIQSNPSPNPSAGQYGNATLLPDGITWHLTLDPGSSWMWKSPSPSLPLVSAGDRFVFRGGIAGNGIFSNWSTNVTLQRLNMYTAGSLATAFVDDFGALTVNDVAINIPNGSSRLISTNADGAHFQNDRGQVTVIHSTIAHNDDDGIAIYATGDLTVVGVPNTNEILLSAFADLSQGDQIQLLSPQGNVLGISTVSQIGMISCPAGSPAGSWCYELIMSSALPSGVQIGDIGYIYNAAGNGAVIEGNQFISHRGNGILDQSPGSVIANNSFTDLNGEAIIIGNCCTYGTLQPGPVPDHVTIQNNSMSGGDNFTGDVGNGVWLYGNTPQILVDTMIPSSQQPSLQVLSADGPSFININSNYFHNSSSAAIETYTGNNIQINNNTVASQRSVIRNAGGEILFCGGYSLSVNGLTVQDNRVSTTSDVEINKSNLGITNLSILPSTLTVNSVNLASTPCFQ